jgi:N-acetylglucosaminyl-diphospho-decaprenol L-rhamnosyltransferase
MPADLAVIIVSWNTRDLTLDALRTLYADLEAYGPGADVWLVDNASTDGTADIVRRILPQTHVIESPQNVGFAEGNNLALRALGFGDGADESAELPRAVYLLNPDTRTHPRATRLLYDALFNLPKAGVTGARLTYGDGSFQHSAFRFPGLAQLVFDLFPVPARLHDTALNGRYPRELYAAGEPFLVDHTLGATMMIRREAILDTGIFDEQFRMYCEEIDWSMRIRAAGYEIYCVPAAHVTHLAGQSTKQIRPQSTLNLWRSRVRLYDKHASPFVRRAARWIIRAGMSRKIGQAHRDFQRGELTAAQRDAMIEVYRTIQGL